jgi:ubiquinone biosynthesis protein
MIRGLRNLRRIVGILRTFALHDALFPLERAGVPSWGVRGLRILLGVTRRPAPRLREGERLVAALHALGPSFIKFGQALSVRPDLVGDAIADDLTALQDRLPPFPSAEARAAIEAEFGRPVERLFAWFDDEPVAAASIAQVHFAVTTDGDEVAVKILRPGIEERFARDLDLFRWLAELAGRHVRQTHRLRPVETVEIFAETVAMEMDLRYEAAAGDELRVNFADDDSFRVPRMDWSRTGRRVLTLERARGIPVDETALIAAAGHDPAAVVANMARVFFLQVFRDGFFHADLHPGNLLVAEDGAIVALDFGIMGRIDKRTRQYLAEMLIGFIGADYRRVAEVHIRAGYVPADQSTEAFAQAARSIAEPIFGLPLREISLARLLAQLFRITERFRMQTQPQLLLLQKTMLIAEGVGRRLYPDTNMWELARPLIEEWVAGHMTPEAKAAATLAEAARTLERLPALIAGLEGSVGSLARDGLRLHIDTLAALAGNGRRPARWPWLAGAALVGVLIWVAL